MNILFVGSSKYDYLQNMMFHGFRSLYGSTVIDYPKLDTSYITYPPEEKLKLHGLGFGISCTLLDVEIDRNDIKNKILNEYFDVIFISGVQDIGKDTVATDVIVFILNNVYSNNIKSKVVILDGQDMPHVLSELYNSKILYFKRSIYDESLNVLPIGFSFPKEKICNSDVKKSKMYSMSTFKNKISSKTIFNDHPQNVPRCFGGSYEYCSMRDYEYIFSTEQEMYEDYRNSYVALTARKEGWDSQRHYEIVFNKCLPFFYDIEKCPPKQLVHWDKKLLKRIKDLKEFDIDDIINLNENDFFNPTPEILELQEEMWEYATNNLTTEHMANYVLGKI